MVLSTYEQREWKRLQQRKEDSLHKKSRSLLPSAARERLAAVGEKAKSVPGADKVSAAYATAAQGLGQVLGSTSTRTLSEGRVIQKYARAGHDVASLDDIHQIDLSAIDAVAKFDRLRYQHAMAAATEGLASAAAITGGETLASFGVFAIGAGAAPGLGTVAGALAVDVAAMLGLAARTVAAAALYYGYDPRKPEEEVFLMSVVALGMASGTSAKTTAYAELSQLTQLLARQAPWTKLNEKVLTRIAQKFAAAFGQSLTKKKLGQFVPAAGMAVGAGLNYVVINRIATSAHDAYRERYLIEKSGGELTGIDIVADTPSEHDDDIIGVVELLEEQDVLPPSSASDGDQQNPGLSSGLGRSLAQEASAQGEPLVAVHEQVRTVRVDLGRFLGQACRIRQVTD